jgi:hypothetical protein
MCIIAPHRTVGLHSRQRLLHGRERNQSPRLAQIEVLLIGDSLEGFSFVYLRVLSG